jgi:hypothetical protein
VQEHEGDLNFATDAWTSPNHKEYVAVAVHFEDKGVPVAMLLDIVEVAGSHSGFNLAAAFTKIPNDFGISNKVWVNKFRHVERRLTDPHRSSVLHATMPPITIP